MLEFDKQCFEELLRSAPPKKELIEQPEFSPYVQEVFDTLAREGELDFTKIDWNAFDLCHVTPPGYENIYTHTNSGWIKGFIEFCRKTPTAQLHQRTFF